ncbi:PAS domain S-box protein [Flavobacterium franklandianum]|uniref:PAS domain S-box protein n=2 Tax=Flavobacterium TaxID=237 RepID=UPI001179A0D6|nr:PAS domain S-box protein [Flavobacterium franklandianum]TRX22364.1 PAS domain S-box protein [Flavobacterium franklandianum]
MKLLFEKKTTLFYILSAILLTTVLLIFYGNNQKVSSSNTILMRSQDVINKSDEVLIDALNIETGFRGYLLSNDETFLQPFYNAEIKIDTDLNQLKSLTKENISQQNRIDILKKSVNDRLVFTRKNIEAKKQNLFKDSDRIAILEKGKILTDKVKESIITIKYHEYRLQETRKVENEKNVHFSKILFLLLLTFLVAIFIFVVLIINNHKEKNNQLETFNANQKSASHYALSLIEASHDPLVTINVKGKIMDMNEALVNITGVTREELVGSDFFDYFTDQQSAREVYQEVFEKGYVADFPLTIRDKDGKLTDVLFNGSVYRNDNGAILGVVIVARDIAEQKWALDLQIANKELAYQNQEKENRANELSIANKELAYQNQEKENRANELSIANKELAYQNQEKENRANELSIANKELAYQNLAYQNQEKENRANELSIANKELAYQNQEKENRANELSIANKELAYQNQEKENRANELGIANEELAYQNQEKENRANELGIANEELAYQNQEKENRANELGIANEELAYQNQEKENRANELGIANEELAYQNIEKENRAAELVIANEELLYQKEEKTKRADELIIAEIELNFQNKEKEKREIANKELEALSYSAKLASQYSLSLIEASRDPLVTINIQGKITDMNEATANIIGMSKEELIDSDFFDYFTEQQKAREVYQEVFKKGSVADAPLTLRNKNGKLTDVLFNGSVYKDDNGNVMGVVIVARDVTEQKRIATELVEARVFAELATEIAEEEKRNAEAATLTAENAVKAKQQFLSNMSHEIRTPMNAIIGFTKVVLKTDLTEKQKEYLSAIKLSGDALIVLINDILDLAKVDAGKMTFECVPFKLASSISAMLHVFETKIQEKNLELVTEYDNNIPEVLLGDPVRLHQIILNLVSNAIKFTSKGKITVSVRLFDEDEESTTVEFAISDTGIGIDEIKMETIFDNFQQATSGTSRLYGGTGLGLAIVKQLVEPQGGTVCVKSKINEGSTFSFTLNFPKTDFVTQFETEKEEIEMGIRNIKVLVVEDMPLNQLLMKTLLDDFGFERDIAENGAIALEKIKEKTYDIILMDLQMPVMNGFEATEYIRNTMNSTIPIIALTADVTTVDLAKCKAVGMNDYIAKPVDERILYNKIIGLVKKPVLQKEVPNDEAVMKKNQKESTEIKYTNLDYLKERTKSNPKLMMEMISIYLQQTPPLLEAMRQSVLDKDWPLLAAATHKIIPSFAIMGLSPDLENKARLIQEAANSKQFTDETAQMVTQIEYICRQASKELEIEFNRIKNTLS